MVCQEHRHTQEAHDVRAPRKTTYAAETTIQVPPRVRRITWPWVLFVCVCLLVPWRHLLDSVSSFLPMCRHITGSPVNSLHLALQGELLPDVRCRVRGAARAGAGTCYRPYRERVAEAEAHFLRVPSAQSARAALERYTHEHHVAGEHADYDSALRLIDEWTSLLGVHTRRPAAKRVFDAGSPKSRSLMERRHHHPYVWADTYSVDLDRQASAHLYLTPPTAQDDPAPQATWVAQLDEDVLAADPTSARGEPPFHGYSAPGNASGRVVYAGQGRREDFARLAEHGIDVRGTIVLVRYGGVFRGLKVRAAEQAGAVGVLIYSDPEEDDDVTVAHGVAAYPDGPARQPSSIQRGSVQALSLYPGDPSTPGVPSYRNATRLPRDEQASLPRIPSLPLSYKNAKRVLASLAGHGVRVTDPGLAGAIPGAEYWTGPSAEVAHMSNEMHMRRKDIWNVYAVIPGHMDEERVVLGNHRDAWVFGAGDPSSGTAVVHEMLRGLGALLRTGWQPLRTIVVASWDAEEYGLVGSTEFGEDFGAHIQAHVSTYHNLDMAVTGTDLALGASPSLAGLLRDAAADAGLKPTHVDPLGSGSDFTVFQQHLGIASSDVSMRRGRGDPVYHYHSNYDSFAWMEHYGDPGFAHHEAMARLYGLLALRSAAPVFSPIDPVAYARELHTYVAAARAVATEPLSWTRIDAALAAINDAAPRFAAHLADVEARVYEAFERHRDAVRRRRMPPTLRALLHDVVHGNRQLRALESSFLDARGLPGRPWYRHLGVAPGRWLGYGATTLPGVTESFTLDGGANAAYEMERLAEALERAARALQTPEPPSP